jgi:peptidoglycan/xylan/chitin deacetylase (PgdA/CDA1 family)
MKAVMYHYVRPAAPDRSHFPYLSLADFERQLDHFASAYGFVSREALKRWVAGDPAPEGVLLTFDDGLKDHGDFVLPALRARGLFGLFYVPSGPIITSAFLDVHKVHLALGRLGGPAVLQWLENKVPEILPLEPLVDGARSHYANQRSDNATKFVKHLFNWQLSAEERGEVLDALFDHAFSGELPRWQDFYLDEQGIRALVDAEMGVGPHSHTHCPLSRLSASQEAQEIESSCDLIVRLGGDRSWGFCYPYGSPQSFNQRTEAAIANAGCPFAFAAAPRDIDKPLAKSARYALPRHNCNTFAHGTASYSEAKPVLSPAGHRFQTRTPTG